MSHPHLVENLAPRCSRCSRRHLLGLPCWNGRYSRRLTALVLATYGDTCWLCLEQGATTADHRLPRSLGGLDELDNLAPAHASCNKARGNAVREEIRAVESTRW